LPHYYQTTIKENTMSSKKLEPLALGGNKSDEEAGSDTETGSSVGSGSESGSDAGTDDASSIPSAGESDDDATASVGSNESDTEDTGATGAAAKSPIQNIQDVISKAANAVGSGDTQDAITQLVSGSKKGRAKGASTGARKSRGKGVLESIASASASLGIRGSDDEGDYEGEGEGEEGSDEYDSDDDDMDKKLKKFDSEVRDEYLANFHPECMMQNYDEIYNLSRVVRDDRGIIVDELHKTLPLLTKYERTRVLGQRAKQINDGAMPFVKVPEGVIDGYLIALKELEEKKIPFIIRRPLPNRGSEYWHLEDLQIIN
jgi:DNA-directed RNA polymerase I, II, and III subunit RPABC2